MSSDQFTSDIFAAGTTPIVQTHLVYQDEYVEVFLRDAVSELTFVTFSPIGIYADGRHYWAQPVADNLDLRCIGIISKADTWFPEISFEKYFHAIEPLLSKRVLIYGSSMGAYAAIRYSRRLRADTVIAFSPQATVSPIDLPGNSYAQHFVRSLHVDMRIRPDDMADRIYLFYDTFYTEDRRQVELIPDGGKLRIVPVRCLRHDTNFVVVGTSVVSQLMSCCLADDEQGAALVIRKAKRTNAATFQNLSLLLLDRRKERWAARAIGHAQAIGPADYRVLRYVLHKSLVLEEDGRQEAAIEILRGVDDSLKNKEEVHIRLGQLLSGIGRHSEAVDAYATALEHGGKIPAVYHGYVYTALMSGRKNEALPLVLRGINLCPADATLRGLEAILEK